MNGTVLVIGYGAVGKPTVQALVECGATVRVATRRANAELPPGVTHVPCDVLDPDDVRRAVAGADQVVLAVGFPYDARVWRTAWPTTMSNVIEACAAAGARLVFLDNLYQLGPQDEPRREDMPLTAIGKKPAILAAVTRIWMTAAETGLVRVAALRCPDFYGPGMSVSHLGASGFGRMAAEKRALLLAPADTPHDFAYVPDIARAIVTLLDASDDAFGQVWNMPCAPTLTPREILRLGANALGRPLRLTAIPFRLLPLLGLFSRFIREVVDVGFTFDRPYRVDGRKFSQRFAFTATPFESGAAASARSFAVGG